MKVAHRRAHLVLWLLVTAATLAIIALATLGRPAPPAPGPMTIPGGAP